MRVIRFKSKDGDIRIGEDHADGTASLLLDAQGVLEPKDNRQALREMLRDRCALIADDDSGIRDSVGAVLDKFGCSCVTCRDGAEAISTLRDHKVDLVVSDIVMPEHDGYAVFAAAKQKKEDLPVILITGFGYDPTHQIVRATKKGLEGVLFKPFTPQQLVDRIVEVISPALACGNGAFIRLSEREKVHQFLAPVKPRDIVGLSIQHESDTSGDLAMFVRPSVTAQDPDKPIRLADAPAGMHALACLTAVVGRRLNRATESESRDGVLGFTLATDVVCDGRDASWGGGRAFDTTCPLGPVIVTPDELADRQVDLVTRINDTVTMQQSVSDLPGLAARTISRISSRLTLEAGSVVLLRLKPSLPEHSMPALSTGDVVRAEATFIGTLENPVA